MNYAVAGSWPPHGGTRPKRVIAAGAVTLPIFVPPTKTGVRSKHAVNACMRHSVPFLSIPPPASRRGAERRGRVGGGGVRSSDCDRSDIQDGRAMFGDVNALY